MNGQNYAVADALAKKVYATIGTSLSQPAYLSSVKAAMNSSPTTYVTSAIAAIPDGDYHVGSEVFRGVRASAEHGRNIKANLKKLQSSYTSLDALFRAYGFTNQTKIGSADIRLYCRFTLDFLSSHGFANEGEAVTSRYTYVQLLQVIRAGVFITQLNDKDLFKVGGIGLDGTSSNSAGAGMAGAADGAGGKFTGTRYDTRGGAANDCPDYKPDSPLVKNDPSILDKCVSPSEGSPLFPGHCNPGNGAPDCHTGTGLRCGAKVMVTNLDSGESSEGIICGACPAQNDENTVKDGANPCAEGSQNIDMATKLAAGIHFGDANNFDAGKHTNQNVEAHFVSGK